MNSEIYRMNQGRFYAEATVIGLGTLVAIGATVGFMGPSEKELTADNQAITAFQQHPQEATDAANRSLIAKGQPARTRQELLDDATQMAQEDAASYNLAKTIGMSGCIVGLLAGVSMGHNMYRAYVPKAPKPEQPKRSEQPKQPKQLRQRRPKRDSRYYDVTRDML